jgi:GH24 family phage-related lysozyme (muramidase)
METSWRRKELRMSDDPALSLAEADLDQARADREGLAWFRDAQQAVLEGVQPGGPPSNTPISQRAFDLIVEFEVSSEQAYSNLYRRPTWPGGASGVTVGIGYDVGYATKPELWNDWQGAIPDAMIDTLERALGVTGGPANALTQNIKNSVDVPWAAAISVHRGKVMPRWVGLVERSLPNTGKVGPDCLGALVSLTYNRGASFELQGDRYAEMRAIKQHMTAQNYEGVPGDLRSMKRLWPTVRGLQIRREREAQWFAFGLQSLPVG